MGIFKMSVYQSLNGRSNRDTWSNTLHVATDVDIKSPEFAEIMTAVADMFKPVLTTDVHILRVKANQIGDNLLNAPNTTPRTVYIGETGERTPMDGVVQTKTAPIEMAFEVAVNCVLGRPATLYLRGALGEDEFTTSGNGEFQLVEGAGPEGGLFEFGAALPSFNAALPNDAIFVIPNKDSVTLLSLTETGRTVTGFTSGGIVIVKRNRKRISAEREMIVAVQRQIDNTWNKVRRLIQRNSGWAEVAGLVATVVALLAAPEAAVAALPAAAALELEIPAGLAAAGEAAAFDAWWAGIPIG